MKKTVQSVLGLILLAAVIIGYIALKMDQPDPAPAAPAPPSNLVTVAPDELFVFTSEGRLILFLSSGSYELAPDEIVNPGCWRLTENGIPGELGTAEWVGADCR